MKPTYDIIINNEVYVNQLKQEDFCISLAIIVTMAVACFASIALLAGSIAALYGLDWYKNKRRQYKTKKSAIKKEYATIKQEQQPVAGQVT
jgi:DnaJ-domain-containing protein 1